MYHHHYRLTQPLLDATSDGLRSAPEGSASESLAALIDVQSSYLNTISATKPLLIQSCSAQSVTVHAMYKRQNYDN